jgi:hypothetical protein
VLGLRFNATVALGSKSSGSPTAMQLEWDIVDMILCRVGYIEYRSVLFASVKCSWKFPDPGRLG